MKNILAAALLIFSTAAFRNDAQAQVNVNVNFGTPVAQSPWYTTDDNYYYLPEQGVYYNVDRRMYVFRENDQWLYARNLPSRYNGYNYRNSHYVIVRDRNPFGYHNVYSTRYTRNYNGGHVVYRRDADRRDYRGNAGRGRGTGNGRHGNGRSNNPDRR